MGFVPVEGGASVGAPSLPPAKAEWSVDVEAKTSTAAILGGTVTIRRREDTEKFHGEYVYVPADQEGSIQLSIPLHDCANLAQAQARAELLVRESLSKTHPELVAAITDAEAAEALANAAPDPF